MTEEVSVKRKSISGDENSAKKTKIDSHPDSSTGGIGDANEVSKDGAKEPTTPTLTSNGNVENAIEHEKCNADTSASLRDGSRSQLATSAAAVAPKPVFGAASTFGSALIFEKMKNKTNMFDSEAKETPQESKAVSATSSFGSFGGSFGANSKFSSALHRASQKKSFLDEPTEQTQAEDSPPPSAPSQQYKQVELTEKRVETGEENERSLYSSTAKLFELDLSNMAEGWKERGRGPLHLNRSIKSPSEARLVMRSNGLLRVILNYKITPTTAPIKGLEASLSPGKFLRMTTVSAEGKPVQYMLKFPNEETRNELFDQVEELKSDIRHSGESLEEKSASEIQPQATGFKFMSDLYENGSEKSEKSGK